MKKTDAAVVVEDSFNVPIKKVWKAITDLGEMKLWYFDNINAFRPEVGGKSKFAVQSGERTFTHLWEITEVAAPDLITYNWKYEEYKGDSFVSFELFEDQGKTKLVLTATTVDDFDDTVPEFKRESCQKGWEYFICYRLVEYFKKLEAGT